MEREGASRSVPRGHGAPIAVDGEADPVIVKLACGVSNTTSRRDKLTQEQLAGLREPGVEWERAQPRRWRNAQIDLESGLFDRAH